MKILVLGGSQGTGALAVKSAIARGHAATAFARTPQKLQLEHPKLTRLAGDFQDPASVSKAVEGHDAVIITAMPGSLKVFKTTPAWLSTGTAHAIKAMRTHGVKRLVVLSALFVGESRSLANPIIRALLVDWMLKGAYQDHERQEILVRESGLDWVLARPSRLTNGPARGKSVKKTTIEPVPSLISRADLADFLVDACEADTWVGKAVQLGG